MGIRQTNPKIKTSRKELVTQEDIGSFEEFLENLED